MCKPRRQRVRVFFHVTTWFTFKVDFKIVGRESEPIKTVCMMTKTSAVSSKNSKQYRLKRESQHRVYLVGEFSHDFFVLQTAGPPK